MPWSMVLKATEMSDHHPILLPPKIARERHQSGLRLIAGPESQLKEVQDIHFIQDPLELPSNPLSPPHFLKRKDGRLGDSCPGRRD